MARRYAVTTHERCSRPPRSPTIVGSAVDTIVWSSDASSMTSMSPPMTSRIDGSARFPAVALAVVEVTGTAEPYRRCRPGLLAVLLDVRGRLGAYHVDQVA